MSKLLLLVAFWEQKTKTGPRTNKFALKTSEDVPKKTAENAAGVGITFAAKADVTDEKLLSTIYKDAKAATKAATGAGFEVITSQAVALKFKKAHTPPAPAPAETTAEAAAPAQPPIETSAVEPLQPIEAAPGEVAGDGAVATPAEEAAPVDHTVVLDNQAPVGESLPVE